MSVAAIIAGALLAVPFVGFAATRDNARYPIAIGLLVAALVYVVFAVVGTTDFRWIATEALGVLLFGGLAVLGSRRSFLWVSAGWTLHVVWDVVLHQWAGRAVFTPAWYPPLCVGFDLTVAVAAMALWRRERALRTQ